VDFESPGYYSGGMEVGMLWHYASLGTGEIDTLQDIEERRGPNQNAPGS